MNTPSNDLPRDAKLSAWLDDELNKEQRAEVEAWLRDNPGDTMTDTQVEYATVILASSHVGYPLSTTHVISGAVLGAGSTRRLSAAPSGRAVVIMTVATSNNATIVWTEWLEGSRRDTAGERSDAVLLRHANGRKEDNGEQGPGHAVTCCHKHGRTKVLR